MPRYQFNPITLLYEVSEEPRYKRWLRAGGVVMLGIVLTVFYIWLYTSVLGWDLPKTARLKKENARWQARIALTSRQLDIYEEALQGIEERDDNVYRSIFGLNVIPEDAKKAVQDPGNDHLTSRLNSLTKRAYVQTNALDEVYGIALNAGDMVSHIPAVPPIFPKPGSYHVASPFGYRTDPVYGGTRFHSGQDLAADQGYPVYVTGDGVVEKVNYSFSGYGNEIVVDHGFGYKTRYAHLSRMDVAEGMKVIRGEQIGAVGKTGKVTGPHLHYEVLYKGTAINPYSFMNLDMDAGEYQAMIDKAVESGSPKTSSTLELLKKHGR